MNTIKYLFRRYPLESLLMVYNGLTFLGLQFSGWVIADKLGLSFLADNLSFDQTLMQHSGLIWLVVSILLTLFIRWIKGLIKFILTAGLVILGAYLLIQHIDILKQLHLF